jgi:hypothetical protein
MESARPRKLLDQGRDAIRLKHYSYRTEKTYVYSTRRYILFHAQTPRSKVSIRGLTLGPD